MTFPFIGFISSISVSNGLTNGSDTCWLVHVPIDCFYFLQSTDAFNFQFFHSISLQWKKVQNKMKE